ncbi:MAG: SurA N-terminal domain-containing protein [Patescibacteria group bacterium]
MENDTTTLQQPNSNQSRIRSLTRFANKKTVVLAVIIGLILVALFYFKGTFVAATVNGSPISRLSVVSQLEKEGGKNVLDSLITEKLIESEVKKRGIVTTDDEINQEIKNIEASIVGQGGTLEAALQEQGMTLEGLKKRIGTQKAVEKILEDKIQVTDEEVNTYITDNKVTLPKGNESEAKKQISVQLRNQKLNQEASQWINGIRTEAKIKYYVEY